MRRTRRALEALAIVGMLVAAPAAAHEKGSGRAMGVVDAISPERIAIRTSDGHVVEFVLTPQTRFTRGKVPVGAQDVRVGARAVVHGAPARDALTAVEVKLAPPGR